MIINPTTMADRDERNAYIPEICSTTPRSTVAETISIPATILMDPLPSPKSVRHTGRSGTSVELPTAFRSVKSVSKASAMPSRHPVLSMPVPAMLVLSVQMSVSTAQPANGTSSYPLNAHFRSRYPSSRNTFMSSPSLRHSMHTART